MVPLCALEWATSLATVVVRAAACLLYTMVGGHSCVATQGGGPPGGTCPKYWLVWVAWSRQVDQASLRIA